MVLKSIADGFFNGAEGNRTPVRKSIPCSSTIIVLSARITAIIDIYDDLLEGKHGQDSDKKAESLRIIEEGSGTFFDPEIVEVFLKVQKQLHHEEG